MLNIAMLSYHTCPLATLGGKDTGGMNVYVRDLTTELGRQGVHVDVFTRSQDEHVPHVLHDLGFGNRVVHIPAGPEQPMPKRELAGYIPQFVEGIKQFAAERGLHYDAIHSHYWMSGLAAEQLKAEWGIPFVHMFHTLGEMKNRVAVNESEKEGAYRLDGERQVLRAADMILAATLAEQAQLQWLYKADLRKVVIIPPGVDTCHFYPIPPDDAKEYVGIPKEDRMILFVGRIEPLKGVGTLIKAMSCLNLKEFERPAYLVVIGGDPNLPAEQMSAEMLRLQGLCEDLCMDRMVVFLGKREQGSLPYYYSAAEVLVMPSHYESFGMVALEAMACGTPVVASQVGGLAFLIQDGVTGFHVPDQDEDALCDRLNRILGDSSLRQRMGAAAAEYASRYSWHLIARQIIAAYEQLLERVS
ncbi:MAG: glycosyltransferase [Anaerolineales bacterium]|jgi:D-inositol-3-phosphate glycosyltransferase|nr:glycosyltransferase [Anaerolineales bacterium]